jgi:hypothetical protein
MRYYGEKIEYDAEAGVYYAEVGGEYIEEARLTDIKSMVCALVISDGDYAFAFEMRGMDEEDIEQIYNNYLNLLDYD